MRVFNVFLSFAIIAGSGLAFAPATARAQQSAPLLACAGELHIVRVSDIKPGKMETFLKAAADQQAWYKGKGGTDQIIVMRVMQQGSDKSWSYSDTEAITDHIEPADRKPGGIGTDAGYDAFVALFKDSSTIKTQYVTCGKKM